MPAPQQASPKSVRWSTITVYEFGVGIGGSSVPKHGGPAIGLSKKPTSVWKTTVESVKGALCHCVHKAHTHEQSSSSSSSSCSSESENEDTNCQCRCQGLDGEQEDHSRRGRRVRWFKPLERINLLEKAGYSEKKIYRMLMESSDIAMSRRLNLRVASSSTRTKKRSH